MGYNVRISEKAKKDIKKLDRLLKKRIRKKIEFYSQNPLFYAKKLFTKSLGSYRWRIGNYRIIFDIERKRIIILRIGHRREVYR